MLLFVLKAWLRTTDIYNRAKYLAVSAQIRRFVMKATQLFLSTQRASYRIFCNLDGLIAHIKSSYGEFIVFTDPMQHSKFGIFKNAKTPGLPRLTPRCSRLLSTQVVIDFSNLARQTSSLRHRPRRRYLCLYSAMYIIMLPV
jgi:hypothetical protein